MTETPTFERQVEFLLERNRSETRAGFEMSELYPLLGCRHLKLGRGENGPSRWEVFEAEQPAQTLEGVVSDALLDIMRLNDTELRSTEGFSILDGLAKQNRWRACLLVTDDAHALSILLAQYAICSRKSMAPPLPGMFIEMHPAVLAILNEWTSPEIAYRDFPPLRVLACALFGEAWVDLFVPEQCETDDFRKLVQTMRPPFLPGLLAADLQALQCIQDLPETICNDI